MSILTPPPGAGVRELIRRRPLVAFFSMAMGFSWLLWLPYVLSNSGLGVLDFDYPKILG